MTRAMSAVAYTQTPVFAIVKTSLARDTAWTRELRRPEGLPYAPGRGQAG